MSTHCVETNIIIENHLCPDYPPKVVRSCYITIGELIPGPRCHLGGSKWEAAQARTLGARLEEIPISD